MLSLNLSLSLSLSLSLPLSLSLLHTLFLSLSLSLSLFFLSLSLYLYMIYLSISSFYGLLSSSLLFFSQRFGRCIHRPSSGVPCLSGHRNDSTWEIIFTSQTLKMISLVESFLCPDKQGTPEEAQRIQRPKPCEKKPNKNENNNPKTLSDKNLQASSQKF